MISSSIIARMIIACAFAWILIISACESRTEGSVPEELLALYGIVTDISESGGTATLTLANGADEWRIIFEDSDRLPDIGRAVIVLARDTHESTLLGASFNYL